MNAVIARDLQERARLINSREENIETLKTKAIEVSAEILSEATIQGADLSAAKARCKPKEWLEWLSSHCPTINHLLANRYMGLAEKFRARQNLTAPESLQLVFQLCDVREQTQHKNGAPKYPVHQEGLWRWAKFSKFVKANPITRWPDPCVQKLREDLEPIAKQLWPQRFA